MNISLMMLAIVFYALVVMRCIADCLAQP